MNAIDLLTQQHRDVERLFELIEDAEGEEKLELVDELADLFATHAKIEEQIFYPGTFAARTEETLRESVEEHLAAKRVLADLLETSIEDEAFDARVKVLQDLIDHHVEEEEGELFPTVKKMFDGNVLEEMGLEMEALFAELLQGEPRLAVANETDAPAPLE
jgi:hemerythrin-like domain-containing protein